jgi:hypothetical protein
MCFVRISLFFLILAVTFLSCEKEKTDPNEGVGKLTSTIGDKSYNFSVSGGYYLSGGFFTASFNASYSQDTSVYQYINITIYEDLTLQVRNYEIPEYSDAYVYKPQNGYATCSYKTSKKSSIEEFLTYRTKNASGNVTITSISSTIVSGTYDIKLVKSDSSKTISIKGNFKSNISSLGNITAKKK